MKKVLVTGGTQGVGLETAKLLLEQGYEVHITYRRSAGKAEELMAAGDGSFRCEIQSSGAGTASAGMGQV